MKRILIVAAVAATAVLTPALAADVGVSISIGQPGFYGQLDIGNFPQPQVINAQPMIIQGGDMNRPPIYLRVPPKYIKHWKKHCREYNACGERVYFVNDDWYNRQYAPRYQEMHRVQPEMRHEDHHENMNERHEEQRHEEQRHEERRNDR